MKEKLVAKLDEHIEHLLNKPELTNEEYGILHCRLREIKWAEEEAARKMDWDSKFKTLMEMSITPTGFGGGGCVQ